MARTAEVLLVAEPIPDLRGEGCWDPLTLPVLPGGGCFILGGPSWCQSWCAGTRAAAQAGSWDQCLWNQRSIWVLGHWCTFCGDSAGVWEADLSTSPKELGLIAVTWAPCVCGGPAAAQVLRWPGALVFLAKGAGWSSSMPGGWWIRVPALAMGGGGAAGEGQLLSSADWTEEWGDAGKMLPAFSSAAVLGFWVLCAFFHFFVLMQSFLTLILIWFGVVYYFTVLVGETSVETL